MNRKEAKAKGLKTYMPDKPCREGHIAPRYVGSGRCVVCNRADSKKFREENPYYFRKYYHEHKEDIVAYNKDYYDRRKADSDS